MCNFLEKLLGENSELLCVGTVYRNISAFAYFDYSNPRLIFAHKEIILCL